MQQEEREGADVSTMSRDMSRDRGYHPHRMCNGLSVVRAARTCRARVQ